ncbi:hypothetical protein E2C01_041915 [Portunus trituberculatus]|uniref:Uncharacterized protein n=1 Tax=Portunus trituberculatus TaxID=210409 RepID=A0A5B7FT57_PORTR|nr:hypothetical protein [Portunus trituberculatus]
MVTGHDDPHEKGEVLLDLRASSRSTVLHCSLGQQALNDPGNVELKFSDVVERHGNVTSDRVRMRKQ